MKGLFLYECYSMRKIIRMYALVSAVYLGFGLMGIMHQVGSFTIFFATMMVISSFSYHEKYKWDLFANTMPVSRSDMVLCQYFFSGLMIFGAWILNLVYIGIGSVIRVEGIQEEFLNDNIMLAIGIIYFSVFVPVLIHFGSERGRIVMLAMFLIPFFLIFLVSKADLDFPGWLNQILLENGKLVIATAVIFVLLILLGSIQVSLRLYKKKNF